MPNETRQKNPAERPENSNGKGHRERRDAARYSRNTALTPMNSRPIVPASVLLQKKLLTPEQLRLYDALIKQTRRRHPFFVLDNDLAIYQCRSATELAAGLDHPLILLAPVQATAGEGMSILAGYADERAVAVMFDLVNRSEERRVGKECRS